MLFYQKGRRELGKVLRSGFPQEEAGEGEGLPFAKFVGEFIARGKSRHKALLICRFACLKKKRIWRICLFFLNVLIKFRCLHAGLEDVDTDSEKQYFFDAR